MQTTSILKIAILLGLSSLAFTSGCTWVQESAGASSVALLDITDVQNCNRLGTTTSSVKDQIGWFSRGEEKVAEELLVLAKNSAAEMEGNILTVNSVAEAGSQQFIIYSCP